MKLSFIIPCYRSEKTIKKVIDEIVSVVNARKGYSYEVIAVNDSSPDNVLDVLKDIAKKNHNIKVIDFMQNSGKDAAMLAGLNVADGDIAIVMDDDYQCPAYEIFRLIEPIERDDYDVSAAEYSRKKESLFKRLCSEAYRISAELMLGQPKDIRLDNFTAISKPIYQEIIKYKNPYPFLDALIMRVTKRIAIVHMEERNRGDDNRTGFTFIKALKMFIDGLTSFSIKPLRIATIMGFITASIGIVYLLFTVVNYFFSKEPVSEGYSSLMSVILFVGGMLMMMIGMMGEYVGRIYTCINQSPQYVIRKTYNIEGNADNEN